MSGTQNNPHATGGLDEAALAAAILRQTRGARQIEETPASKPIRVLVIEDNPGDVALIRRAILSIRSVDFKLSQVSRLSSALVAFKPKPDVILVDLNLPDSQDLDTLRSLRKMDAAVPIIVLTGIEDRRIAVEALENGAQDYLVKGRADGHLLGRAIMRCLAA